MNYNSKLCSYINEHPDTWEDDLKEIFIKVSREGSLAIFKYDIFADFSNPLVKESRGIIIDLDALEVVCFPFNKFNNYNHSCADKIDWNSARVQEKVDGSIFKLWNDKLAGKWRWSSNGMITPENKFLELINRCTAPSRDWFNTLDKDNTYIFELISPDNQVVVKYNKTELVHLGTRNNLTGQELEVDIGIRKPKAYALKTEEECIEFAKTINKSETAIEHEGFVIVDKDYNRVKIKSPDYLIWHRLVSNRQMKKEDFLTMIIKTPEKLDDFVSTFKEYEPYIEYYKTQFDNFIADLDMFISDIRANYDGNRRDIALMIKNHPLKAYGFKALDKDTLSGIELFNCDLEFYDKNERNYAPLFSYIKPYEFEQELSQEPEDIELD